MTTRCLMCTCLILIGSIFALSTVATAQEDSDLQMGLKSFGDYQQGEYDSVDLTATKLNVHIPLWSYPQKGNVLHVNFSIHYDSLSYHQPTSCPGGPPCPWALVGVGGPFGQDMNTAKIMSTAGIPALQHQDTFHSPPNQYYLYSSWTLTESDGETHHMGAIGGGFPTYYLRAVDGSGYYGDLNTYGWNHPILYDANGTKYDRQAGTITDTNGNAITNTLGNVVDTIGRHINAIPTGGSGGNLGHCSASAIAETDWTIPGQGTDTVTLQLCWGAGAGGGYLTDVVLPNETAYRFKYEDFQLNEDAPPSNELTEITLPTGGTITYTWTTLQGGGCGAGLSAFRAIASRKVNDGTGDKVWTYSWQAGWPGTRVLTVTDPLGNKSVHTSNMYGGGSPFYCNWKEAQSQQKDSSGNVLQTVNTQYAWTSGQVLGNILPTTITTAWPSNLQRRTSNGYASTATFVYDYYAHDPSQTTGSAWATLPAVYYTAHPYTVTESDYGAGAPGSTLRTTTTYYEAFGTGNTCSGSYCTNNLLNLKLEQDVSGAGNPPSTKYFYDSATTGNLSSIQRKLGSSYITTDTRTYYTSGVSKGMLYQESDALGHTTTYAYDSSGAFPNSVKDALNHETKPDYDDTSGLLSSSIDPNNQTTTYSYESMNRLASVSHPDGGSVSIEYNDVALSSSVQVTRSINASQQKVEIAKVDGMGRVTQTQLASDPEGSDYVAITYDGLGRKASVSNPYRSTSEPTYGLTQYLYDALNRPTTQTQPDGSGSTITYTYSDNTVTVKEEAGKKRKTQTDGLGRLAKVWEDPTGLNYETDYGYDCMGNLLSVSQQGTNRSFVYDSLSRLTSATNPEAGTITYTYDNDGTLLSKKDGRNITITYTPDTLHRLTSKSYSNSEPTIHYCYDNQQTACGTSGTITNGLGRRTGMADVSGATTWSYDAMGRPLAMNKSVTGVLTYTDYQYNLDGSLFQEFYPDYSIIQYAYNNAGRPIAANYDDIGYSFNYVANATYTASGALTGYQNDSGATISNSYNQRLQPNTMSVSTSHGTIFNLSYNYNAGSGDNGNVNGVTNNLDGSRTQTYTYDSLSRLATYASSGAWGNTYTYDSRGNLTAKSGLAGHSMGESWTNASYANNQLIGYGYDGAGNMNSINGFVYNIFNAENQWASQTTYNVAYTYDGDGQKVKDSGGASGTKVYAYDAAGQVVEEFDGNGGNLDEYLYFGGRRMARVHGFGPVYYYYADHLGTPRVITDGSGNKCYDGDFFPWGAEQQLYVNSCPQNYKFTGKERDPDMGVDYFGARFYQGAMARFYSPDSPSYSCHENPQSWNLYAYALNNPVTFRDADGHKIDCANNTQQCQKDAAAATGNAQAASRVTTQTTTTQHSFLGLFHFTTTETQIAITGDLNSFRALSPNASKLADLVASKDTITVTYDHYARPSFWESGIALNGGSTSYTPSQGYGAQAFIDPTRIAGAVYDPDAVAQGIPQANTGEEFAHEVLGHIWGEVSGGAPAGTRANMRDSIVGEDAVRALDPARGQKGLESHHNYNEMPPD